MSTKKKVSTKKNCLDVRSTNKSSTWGHVVTHATHDQSHPGNYCYFIVIWSFLIISIWSFALIFP